ncbi:MAG: RsiV family protein [Treponema sp.]|nr:RsiV family protein [Treponema sp.]
MSYKKEYIPAFVLALVLLTASCVSAPQREREQFSPWHYSFAILFDTEQPEDGPRLEIMLSLLRMNYPAEHIEYFNEVLYSGSDLIGYRDWVLDEHREDYRDSLSAMEDFDREIMVSNHWKYMETITIRSVEEKGLVIEREYFHYNGGANGLINKRNYVLDMEARKRIRVDDLFLDYQGDAARAVIYEELRNYSGLNPDQPLSAGIFKSDHPELSFNFYVLQEGFGMHWDPDEIAPNSEGGIDIIIPWRKIRPLLLHSGMELLTKFGIYLFI